MDKFFKISENNTTVKTEILAGITTFMTMAYILFVNPDILSAAGMDKGAVFTATCLASFAATMLMGLWAKLPFALAPGMGLNAFFAYTVCGAMGYSWQFALTAILIEGVIFLILSFFNVREVIVNKMPKALKSAIAVGIGLFIALIGFYNAGIVETGAYINRFVDPNGEIAVATIVKIGNLLSAPVVVAIVGLIITSVLLVKKVPGALLIGILVSTAVALFTGVVTFNGVASMPPDIMPIAFKFDFSNIFSMDMVIVVFTFLFTDLFDTVGTLLGVATKAKMLDKDGNLPGVKKALTSDAVGTVVGACLGTSTVTTYVESAAGVAEGGRTGLTAVTTATLFGLALFISPIALMVPGAATAPVLILVGMFMMSPITEIDFSRYADAIPAFLAIAIMPFTYSISDGIGFGIIAYTILNLISAQDRKKNINAMLLIVSILFIIKFVVQ